MILRKKVNAVTHGVTYGVTNLTNKTNNKFFTFNGKTMILKDW